MPAFDRSDPDGFERIDDFEEGVGWFAHPNEQNTRASHAVACEEGVWVLDPLDAPGIDDLIVELGDVVGVAVCSSFHARDAGTVAERHGVSVHVPEWMGRVQRRVDAPVERFEGRIGGTGGEGADEGTGFRVLRSQPIPVWQEAILYRERDGTLYVPDSLGTTPLHLVGDERLGHNLGRRLLPLRRLLGDLSPERILVGHGEGVFEDADAALVDALSGNVRKFPRALLGSGPGAVRSMFEALLK